MVGDESTSASTLSSFSNRMDSLTGQRNERMDKLRKLNMFAGSSNEVFSVGEEGSLIDGLAQNIQTGLSQIQTEFASFGGTFSSHSNDMEWAKNIEGEWDKKAKIDEDYQKVLEKIKDGKELSEDDVKKIEAYKKRYTNRELPETVQVALDKHKQAIEDKKLKAAAKEVSEKEGISYEDALKIVESTVTEEGVSSYLDKIKVNYPKLAEYIQYFTKTDKMGNIHISILDIVIKKKSNDYFKEKVSEFRFDILESMYFDALNEQLKGNEQKAKELLTDISNENLDIFIVRNSKTILEEM